MSAGMGCDLEVKRLHRASVLSHYTTEQCEGALNLYHLAKRHLGTGGGNTAAKFLLGLYNGPRFPFDLTDLRRFDAGNLDAAMTVLLADCTVRWCEIHVLLDAILGAGAVSQLDLEIWAYDLRLPKRAKKDELEAFKQRFQEAPCSSK